MVSPINAMIDKACGYDPKNPPPPLPEEAVIVDDERASKALLKLADAAKAWEKEWSRDTDEPARYLKAGQRLAKAVHELIDSGW